MTTRAQFWKCPIPFRGGAVLAVAWAVLALAAPARAAVLNRGPFLQVATSNGITICWRTDVATDSRVRCGSSPQSLSTVIDNPVSTTSHACVLTGLTPETRYYYSVGSTTQVLAGGTSDYTFWTAPAPGTSRPTRIWAIGDSGQPGSDQTRVKNGFLNWTGSRGADVWLMLGDNAYDSGTDAQYQSGVFSAYPEVLRKFCLWPTRGNHDASSSVYYDIFTMPTLGQAGGVPSGTEAYYSYDYGNIHFICLDSQGSSRSSTGAMATWLRADLAATRREWLIAYWHHPPYTKGSHDSDTESQLIDMRQNFLPILEGSGVDLVLTGHSHSYERSYLLDGHYGSSSSLTSAMKLSSGDGSTGSGGDGAYHKPAGLSSHQGAVYAVAGSSSKLSSGSLNHPAMVVSLYRLGSMVIDIDHSQLVAHFLDDNGTSRDDFTILKNATVDVSGPSASSRAGAELALRARPNPFTSAGARFEYVLPGPGRVTLAIYRVDGTRIASLVDQELPAGSQSLVWDGHDSQGRPVVPGVYFATLRSRGDTRVERLVRLQ